MTTKHNALRNLGTRGIRKIANIAEGARRDHLDVDLVLSAALSDPDLPEIHYPVPYVEFLRNCIEPVAHDVAIVKSEPNSPETATERFKILVDQLRTGLPAVEYSVARQIALISDNNRNLSVSFEIKQWGGDAGLHFSISSSLGAKGRILFNVVRFMRSKRCLELGTAYGMSALFILAALKAYAQSGFLTTVEGWEILFQLTSPMLKQQYGEMVSCQLGKTNNVLPQLVTSLGEVDFMFHDAGHSREDYVNDFAAVVDVLAPGSVVLFDDIRWDNARFGGSKTDTYEGWKAVVSHNRVRRAVEIDGMLGLLLMA